jgi:tRNA threonylcarbamoyl adenosine modification protein YeaZ
MKPPQDPAHLSSINAVVAASSGAGAAAKATVDAAVKAATPPGKTLHGRACAALRAQAWELSCKLGGALVAIDTSTAVGSVCVVDGRRGTVSRQLQAQALPSEHLVQTLAEALEEALLPIAAVRALVVGQGPGSFTGLRVGLATAHGLTCGLQCRLVGVSSLQALAHTAWLEVLEQVPRPEAHTRPILAILDARGGAVYAGAYRYRLQDGSAQGAVPGARIAQGTQVVQEVLLADAAMTLESLHTWLLQQAWHDQALCVGDLAETFAQRAFASPEPSAKAARTWQTTPQARSVLALGASQLLAAASAGAPDLVLPQYLQACAAERRLNHPVNG